MTANGDLENTETIGIGEIHTGVIHSTNERTWLVSEKSINEFRDRTMVCRFAWSNKVERSTCSGEKCLGRSMSTVEIYDTKSDDSTCFKVDRGQWIMASDMIEADSRNEISIAAVAANGEVCVWQNT
jgi:hypothetical protein